MRRADDMLRRRVGRGRRTVLPAMLLMVLATTWAGVAPAQDEELSATVETLDLQVFDEYGVLATGGAVLFCPEAGECREYPVSAAGLVRLEPGELVAQTVYTVIVYRDDGVVQSMTSTYLHDPAVLERGPDALPPQLRGHVSGGLDVDLGGVGPFDISSPGTGLLLGVSVPLLLGDNFGADADALAGVMSVSPGVGLVGSVRFGLPTGPRRRRGGVGFHELTVCYAQNRYATRQLRAPDEESDLTFHRISLAYGRGRLSRRSLLSMSAAVAYGGIYDGGRILEYEGRSYGMLGFGLQGRMVQSLVGDADRSIGLMGQAELMYYAADGHERDHWHGLAPSVALGVAVR